MVIGWCTLVGGTVEQAAVTSRKSQDRCFMVLPHNWVSRPSMASEVDTTFEFNS